MTAGKVSLQTLVMGLLARQPMSGYDIKVLLKGLRWLIGSPSSGSLYPLLRTLLEEGMATVQTVPGVGGPTRKIYSITDAGDRALRGKLEQGVAPSVPLKAFVLRLLLADSLGPDALVVHLEQRRDQVANQLSRLGQMARALDAGLGQNLALDYRRALATAELAWIDSALDELSELPPPGKEGNRQGASQQTEASCRQQDFDSA
jgi:DNA-binding PadR family transcriptional regulator